MRYLYLYLFLLIFIFILIFDTHYGYAYNELSIRAEGSFSLFENDYDFMQDPSRLPLFESNSLYTNLTNRGGSSFLQAGFSGTTPFGGIGMLFDFSLSGTTMDNSVETINPDPENERDILTTRSSFTRTGNYSLYAGYGREITDTLNLGAGFVFERGVNRSSLGYSESTGTFIMNGEGFTEEDLLLGMVENFTGSIDQGSQAIRALLSFIFRSSERFEFEGDIYYSYITSLQRIDAEYSFESGESGVSGTFKGLYPHYYPSVNSFTNYKGSEIRLDLEPYMKINDEFGAKLTFIQSYTWTGFADDSYSGFLASTYYLFPTFIEMEKGHTISLNGSPFDGNRTYGLFQLNYLPSKRVDVRGGIGIDYRFYSMDITMEEEKIEMTEGSVTYHFEEGNRYYGFLQDLYIHFPVAVEIRTTRNMTLRIGSRYNLLVSSRCELTEDLYHRDSSEAGEYYERENIDIISKSMTSSLDYAFGFAYRLKKYFTIEGIFVGNATIGDTIDFGNNVGIQTLLLSGTIHF